MLAGQEEGAGRAASKAMALKTAGKGVKPAVGDARGNGAAQSPRSSEAQMKVKDKKKKAARRVCFRFAVFARKQNASPADCPIDERYILVPSSRGKYSKPLQRSVVQQQQL